MKCVSHLFPVCVSGSAWAWIWKTANTISHFNYNDFVEKLDNHNKSINKPLFNGLISQLQICVNLENILILFSLFISKNILNKVDIQVFPPQFLLICG